jgi:peptidoglycan/xylan/chitin deacetylase (PgdA/CDA1 family)
MPPARVVLWAATAGVLVMTVRAALRHPPPVGWAIFAAVAYLSLVLVGVFSIRLRMFADAVVRGPKGARGVVLTFDDGPDPETTPKVLDALDEAGAKATFFVIAKKAEAHPDLVREMVARGHSVGLHSFEHDRLFSLRSEKRVRRDLEHGLAVLDAILGTRTTFFRPPIGHTNPVIARVADALDLLVVGWTVSGRDGIRARPEDVVARVRRDLNDGVIVALHDASERRTHDPAGPHALPAILDAIHAARLDVVPLESWIEAQGL